MSNKKNIFFWIAFCFLEKENIIFGKKFNNYANMRLIKLIIIVTILFSSLCADGQCKQRFVYECALQNQGLIFLKEFNTKFSSGKVQRHRVILNKGYMYTCNSAIPLIHNILTKIIRLRRQVLRSTLCFRFTTTTTISLRQQVRIQNLLFSALKPAFIGCISCRLVLKLLVRSGF